MNAPRANYWDYIQVEQLLDLQHGLEDSEAELSNDEVRFIVIHQIDELWFKLALRELATARDLFGLDHVPETSLASASAALRRVTQIFELCTGQFRLMETMRTRDYLKFRDSLSPASGFQSAQMREIEILLGLEPEDRAEFGSEQALLDAMREADGSVSPALQRVLDRRADTPSLKQAVYSWLQRTPIDGSRPGDEGDESVVQEYVEAFLAQLDASTQSRLERGLQDQALTEADRATFAERFRKETEGARRYLRAEDEPEDNRPWVRRLRAAILFIDSNRDLPLLSWPCEIVDGLIAAEQSMLIFRQRHARMVERVIGRRVGTGGSAGVDYLDRTALSYRVFKEIWAARSLLLPPDASPPMRNADYYGLRSS